MSITLLSGLYLFFFLVSVSTYGNPFPFLGHIYIDTTAKVLVITDCLLGLYLFVGIIKRQFITWHLLIYYNLFQVFNIIVNVKFITVYELEKVMDVNLKADGIWVNNIASALAILLLTQYIFKNKRFFINRTNYLF